METAREGVGPSSCGENASSRVAIDRSTEWFVDAFGCEPGALSSLQNLQCVCREVVERLRLRVIRQPLWHQFPSRDGSTEPGGVTGLYLLAESHFTCHTFPEDRLATFNLYCCRGQASFDWNTFLQARLAATDVVVRSAHRGRSAHVFVSQEVPSGPSGGVTNESIGVERTFCRRGGPEKAPAASSRKQGP